MEKVNFFCYNNTVLDLHPYGVIIQGIFMYNLHSISAFCKGEKWGIPMHVASTAKKTLATPSCTSYIRLPSQ